MSTHNKCFQKKLENFLSVYCIHTDRPDIDEAPQNAASHRGIHCLPDSSSNF